MQTPGGSNITQAVSGLANSQQGRGEADITSSFPDIFLCVSLACLSQSLVFSKSPERTVTTEAYPHFMFKTLKNLTLKMHTGFEDPSPFKFNEVS